jgi:alpha-amylase/alpha-mannosidase (GH57 family)
MNRYICIHGHFYQPPRENAWLEDIELQDSAYPYHDWNERITYECYAANATSRILNDQSNIIDIVNNYSAISFNFGPTLLSWMERHAPSVYRLILSADRESREKFGGHGSALAQAYNHMIMPLASARDKETQILWGIEDFRHRFGRDPEGMWLPETAVDVETLDIMAQNGLRFTVLSPYQARRTRKTGGKTWKDVSNGRVDPSIPYSIALPSGRPFSLFFYDAVISRAVAFEKLLHRGEAFAERLMTGFSEERAAPQIVHIATDGESYGHHHRHGDMALAYALHTIESQNLAQITNYGQFLENHPPGFEVEIFENSSWSCIHGVARWREDCGCNSGGNPDWHQAWRKPLREALDWLRDAAAPHYEQALQNYFDDPWQARNEYIRVLFARNGNPEAVDDYLMSHAKASLEAHDKVRCLKLLELQRHAMLMYTSCGWFFDEISGIETVQIIQYAGRVIQLARDVLEKDLKTQFLNLLEKAPSNISEHQNGRRIYEKFVMPAVVDLKTVCAHYAISSLFTEEPGSEAIYCYDVTREDYKRANVGNASLAPGAGRGLFHNHAGSLPVLLRHSPLGRPQYLRKRSGVRPRRDGVEKK